MPGAGKRPVGQYRDPFMSLRPHTALTAGRVAAGVLATVLLSTGCAVDDPVGDDVITGRWQLVGDETAELVIDNGVAASVEVTTGCRRALGSLTVSPANATSGAVTFTLPGRSTNACDPAEDELVGSLAQTLESVTNWEVNATDDANDETGRLRLSGDRTTQLMFRRLDG